MGFDNIFQGPPFDEVAPGSLRSPSFALDAVDNTLYTSSGSGWQPINNAGTATGSVASGVNTTVPNLQSVFGQIVPNNNQALKQFATFAANVALGTTGQRFTIMSVGDSVTDFTVGYWLKQLQQQGGAPLAGVYLSGNSPWTAGMNVSSSGGTTQVINDFSYWMNGVYYNIPASGVLNLTAADVPTGGFDTLKVYYVKQPGAGSLTVQGSADGISWTTIGTINASNATVAGGVQTYSISNTFTHVQLIGVSAPVNVIDVGLLNSTITGIVITSVAAPGIDIAHMLLAPSAVTQPILADYGVKLFTWEMKENSVESGSLFSTLYPQFWNMMLAGSPKDSSGNNLADVITIGTSPTGTTAVNNTDIATVNEIVRQYAASNGFVYFDVYDIFGNYDRLQATGWITPPETTHMNSVGQNGAGLLFAKWMGQWASLPVIGDVSAINSVTTPKLILNGTVPTITGVAGTTSTDMAITPGRQLVVTDIAGNGIFSLASGKVAQGSTNNWITPFQLSDFSGNLNGKWLGIALNSGNAGIWSNAGSGAPTDWYTNSTLILNGPGWLKFVGAGTGSSGNTITATLPNTPGNCHLAATDVAQAFTQPFAKSAQTVISSATTIAPTAQCFHVSGTTAIATITPPAIASTSNTMYQITIIPDGAFTTTTGGNIALATTAVVNKALIMTYDPATSKWYPSY